VEWMNLKHITLRKKSDTKTTCCLIPSMWDMQNRQIFSNRKQTKTEELA
jgi:hypothetical protein